jgi:hypothetical protein
VLPARLLRDDISPTWAMYNFENFPDKPSGWQDQGYYDDFLPNKPPYKGFLRIVFQLQAFRVENLRLML